MAEKKTRIVTDGKDGGGVSLSIRVKLIISFAAVSLIPMTLMLYLLSLRLEGSFERMSRLRIESALNGIRSEYNRKRQTLDDRVRDVADSPVLSDLIVMYDYDQLRLIDEVVKLRAAAGLDVLLVVDTRGRLLASGAHRARFGGRYEHMEQIHRALAEEPVTVIENQRVNDREFFSLDVYRPVYFNNSVVAVLVGGSFIDREYMKMLEDLSSAKVSFHPVDETDAPAAPRSDRYLQESKFLKAIGEKKILSKPLLIDGRKHMVGGVPLRARPGSGPLGYFVLSLPLSAEEKIVSDVTASIVLFAACVVFASILAGSLLSLSLTRPIGRLVSAARRIGGGEIDEKMINFDTRDEIGLLGRTFKGMMTDLKSYREKLVMTERTAAWRDIARSIAHEIKNPLSPIQLSVENLRKSYSVNRARFDKIFPECTDTILEEVERLRQLATEFSDFARMPLPVFEDVFLSEALENAVHLFRETAESAKIKLKYKSISGLRVRADRNQLVQVFDNIIKNAIEAMDGGGEIRITEKEVDGKPVVLIEDNGPGIPRENLPRIFSPYFTTKPVGSGLGLPIVQRILNDHGAGIEVHSEQGVGTWMIITFPEPGAALERREEQTAK